MKNLTWNESVFLNMGSLSIRNSSQRKSRSKSPYKNRQCSPRLRNYKTTLIAFFGLGVIPMPMLSSTTSMHRYTHSTWKTDARNGARGIRDQLEGKKVWNCSNKETLDVYFSELPRNYDKNLVVDLCRLVFSMKRFPRNITSHRTAVNCWIS